MLRFAYNMSFCKNDLQFFLIVTFPLRVKICLDKVSENEHRIDQNCTILNSTLINFMRYCIAFQPYKTNGMTLDNREESICF